MLQVFHTRYATIGVAICWDQWFAEAARVMALQGAEIIFYPTAIGSEPQDSTINSQPHWTRVMQGQQRLSGCWSFVSFSCLDAGLFFFLFSRHVAMPLVL